MFTMRLKLGPARNNEWRCCFCLHVRTATIILGIWHLILHILALIVIAIIYRNHHSLINDKVHYGDVDPGNLLPTPLSKVKDGDNPYYLPTTQDGRTVYSEIYPSDMDMGALMTICTLSLTLLLVYGTIKGKAMYLLPFLCLLLFDFIITTLTATSYFCYLRSVHQFVNDNWQNLPFHKQMMELSPQYLSLFLLMLFLLSMLWKAYCVSIVWRCYKFLTLRQQTSRSTVHYILPGGASGGGGVGGIEGVDGRLPEPDYSSLLPDYDAACASAMKQPPPPSYQVAMEGLPPSYPDTVPAAAIDTVHIVNPADTVDHFPRYGYVTAAGQPVALLTTATLTVTDPVITPVNVTVATPNNNFSEPHGDNAITTPAVIEPIVVDVTPAAATAESATVVVQVSGGNSNVDDAHKLDALV